jgi:hypothetical protein
VSRLEKTYEDTLGEMGNYRDGVEGIVLGKGGGIGRRRYNIRMRQDVGGKICYHKEVMEAVVMSGDVVWMC